jgi:hypothetical protein
MVMAGQLPTVKFLNMNILRKTLSILVLTAVATTVSAQSLDEARSLAEDGSIDEAISMLRVVTAENPKDYDAAQLLGELLWDSGNDAEAATVLESLRKKGNRNATLQLARMALCRYDLDQANTLLAAYRKSLRNGKKLVAEDLSGDLESQIEKAESMLDRVQNIEVIDSVAVDAEEFFKHYPISSAAGRLSNAGVLPKGFPAGSSTMVHQTESGNRMVWAAPDDSGVYQLYGSSSLLNNEWETPELLGDELADGGDALFPYLMPDGITLYYANDGENSLGGFDIFQTRRGDEGFLQSANIGMPFNSPFNDYLLVVDEYTGAGWFATDRNRHPGKITIYTFIPQELRVNVDVDDPDLLSLARLDNIAKTQKGDSDYAALRRTIEQNSKMQNSDTAEPAFKLSLPNNRMYTSLEDFRNARAKASMENYIKKETNYNSKIIKLQQLRDNYRNGDRSQSQQIQQMENQVEEDREELKSLRNSIIELEK